MSELGNPEIPAYSSPKIGVSATKNQVKSRKNLHASPSRAQRHSRIGSDWASVVSDLPEVCFESEPRQAAAAEPGKAAATCQVAAIATGG